MQVAGSREDPHRLLKHGGAATHARRDARDAKPSLRSTRQPTECHDIMIHTESGTPQTSSGTEQMRCQ